MNWTLILEIGIPIILLLIPIILKMIPTDSPANKWASLVGNILVALLKDYSKEKDDNGEKITHEEIKFAEKLRNHPNLRDRLGLKKK